MEERSHEASSHIEPLSTCFRLLGILPLIFFLAQGVHYWRINQLGHMLWLCNIGNLLLAIGIFINQPVLIRVAVLWSIPGLLTWFRYVVVEFGVFPSSTLAHVGGPIVGVVVLRRIGMDRRAWLYAFFWYLALQLICRMATPVELNVNVAQKVYDTWHGTFRAYWQFWLVLTMVVAVVLWSLGRLLNWLWPAWSHEGNNSVRTRGGRARSSKAETQVVDES